jgi:hypothetical protein
MTVLLVLFLVLAFVGTDQVVQAAARRAEARREAGHPPLAPAPGPPARTLPG